MNEFPTVAVIDDEMGSRQSLRMILKDEFNVLSFGSVAEALRVALAAPRGIDLVFVDIRMPEFDGLEFLTRLKATNPEIEVVIITAFPSAETAIAAMRAGAFDYLVKPFDMKEVLRVARKAVDNRESSLEHSKLLRSLKDEMQRTHIGTTEALIQTIDAKDSYTRGHSERVAETMLLMSRELGLPEDTVRKYYVLARLHDIGKIGVSEAVLRKPNPLSEEEWGQMKQHPAIGYNILQPVDFLRDELEVVLHHHERFDGSGYPLGARGTNIPLGARLIGIVDSIDAMTSERCYSRRKTLDEAMDEVAAFAGVQFDPELVDVVLPVIQRQYTGQISTKSAHVQVAS